jgi:hypothetical protein
MSEVSPANRFGAFLAICITLATVIGAILAARAAVYNDADQEGLSSAIDLALTQSSREAYQSAANQPTSSSNFYFHAAIFDITQQLRAFPNDDLQRLLKDVKEKYISLRYLKGQPVQPTGCEITAVAFFKGLSDNDELIDPAEKLPARTDAVYMGFDITSPFIKAGGLASGSYRVDLHINGEYLASGELTVE